MKRLLLLLLMPLLSTANLYAQSSYSEFGTHRNGLIYSDTTMGQLHHIVDSLNLSFRSCDLNKEFYAIKQYRAHYIYLDTGSIKDARKDIERGITYTAFLHKYPHATPKEDLILYRNRYVSYDGDKRLEFESLPTQGGYFSPSITINDTLDEYTKKRKGTWLYSYSEKTDYSKESIRAFYFLTESQKQQLPQKYAKMVQYTDCLIDTNTTLYTANATAKSRYDIEDNSIPDAVIKFNKYIATNTNQPKYNKKDKKYYQKYYKWQDSTLYVIIDNKLKNTQEFQTLLKNAVEAALKDNYSTGGYFEKIVGKYYSKKAALDLKRSRIVVGGCSQDQAPRIHAMNIAILSAEAVSWETFLRAHLDIMNDNFSRVSDGSYAWDERKTYIKELEELDINVVDLLLGISLRVKNPADNHYYGRIDRVGRALSETKYNKEVEDKMLSMIADPSLDVFNRVLIYFLFTNYNGYLTDDDRKKANERKLEDAIQKLPSYVAHQLTKDD